MAGPQTSRGPGKLPPPPLDGPDHGTTIARVHPGRVYFQNIKMIDLGFARADMHPVVGQFKRSETFCGCYAFTSPKILMGIPYVPQAADVWSMGVILYYMASAP